MDRKARLLRKRIYFYRVKNRKSMAKKAILGRWRRTPFFRIREIAKPPVPGKTENAKAARAEVGIDGKHDYMHGNVPGF